MKIGLDFDNTIVDYDQVFYEVGLKKQLITANIPANKYAVKAALCENAQEAVWTELQGYVYGKCMEDAAPYPGVLDFITQVVKAGHELVIISHKTQFPYAGPKYDLRVAAKAWIDKYCALPVFFEASKMEKINRIALMGCDIFIDDLLEILTMPEFPAHTQRILFDPEQQYVLNNKEVWKFSLWKDIQWRVMQH